MFGKKAAAVLTSLVIALTGVSLTALPASAQLRGDVNGDERVNSDDALIVLRASVGMEELTENEFSIGDVDGNGVLDSSDAIWILRYQLDLVAIANSDRVPLLGDMFKLEQPLKGIDVSFWQEAIDFNAVKASGRDFVILKAGSGNNDPWYGHPLIGVSGQGKDPRFDEYYAQAKAAGLYVGVYWYSYAMSVDQARQEAESCLAVLDGRPIDYPIFYDIEERWQLNQGTYYCSSIMETFGSTIADGGYYPGFYMAASPAQDFLYYNTRESYDAWIAHWNPYLVYNGSYGLWQRGTTYVNGVRGIVDDDVCYYDYPRYLKLRGLNGL